MARPIWLFILAVAAVLYGSLFPFEFADAPKSGIVGDLLASLNKRPSRGDLVANLILYLPIGLFWTLSFPRAGRLLQIGIGTLIGVLMSVGVEIAQIYDSYRTPSLYDVALNTISTLIGAISGRLLIGLFNSNGRLALPDPAGAILAAAWLAHRLFPFVPTLDFQQVKNALKPLATIDPAPLRSLLDAASWLAFASIAAANFGGSGFRVLLICGVAVLVAKPFLVWQTLQLYEVIGLVLALLVCRFASGRRLILGLVLLAAIALNGLAPFKFISQARPFYFEPFIGFIAGNIATAANLVLAKVFLYGAALWLLARGGWRLLPATLVVVVVLTAIEIAQIFLPGRTAEITDPLIAVLMAGLLAVLPARKRG
jgi:VanZ family protein